MERRETIEALLFNAAASSKEEDSKVIPPVPMTYTVGSRVVSITDHLKKRKSAVTE